MRPRIDRRNYLKLLGAASCTAAAGPHRLLARQGPAKKPVAAVVTVYRRNSHADVIVSKILKGWEENGGAGPSLQLASLYVDQFPEGDLSRDLSRQFGFPIVDSIEQAITLGTDRVAVDGVLSIGEHGDYPWNDLGQHLYPRRRFFEAITQTFERCGEVVPVFNDKHLGPVWDDAQWMYQRARKLKIPFMAGSSLPVTYRQPDASIAMGSRVRGAVAVGYSGLDVYGFHTLEFLQCFLERRRGGEDGVRWVRCLPGTALAKLIDERTLPPDLLDAVLKVVPHAAQDLRQADPAAFHVFLVHYRDGLTVPVLMLSGYAQGIGLAVKLANGDLVACLGEERPEPRYPHFAYLLKGIEQMIQTGVPAYPVERTLLTAGVLDRLLRSRANGYQRVDTPELAIAYQPVDHGCAPHIELTADARPG